MSLKQPSKPGAFKRLGIFIINSFIVFSLFFFLSLCHTHRNTYSNTHTFWNIHTYILIHIHINIVNTYTHIQIHRQLPKLNHYQVNYLNIPITSKVIEPSLPTKNAQGQMVLLPNSIRFQRWDNTPQLFPEK